MAVNGMVAQHQLARNFLIAQPLRDEPQHFKLSLCERLLPLRGRLDRQAMCRWDVRSVKAGKDGITLLSAPRALQFLQQRHRSLRFSCCSQQVKGIIRALRL